MGKANYDDILGNKVGRLIIESIESIEFNKKSKRNRVKYNCYCRCSNMAVVGRDELRFSRTKSCGCLYNDVLKSGVKPNTQLTKICNMCKKKYQVAKHREDSKFCSIECRNKGFELPRKIICKNCSCAFTYKKGGKPKKYCSKKCMIEMFRDNSKDELLYERNRYKYSVWRKSVFKRDGYECKKCGVIGGRLNAHHISGFTKYKKIRFDIDNGVTMCEKCHKNFHRIYGLVDFDSSSLLEYLKEYL